jgi:hypothetical protein
MRSLIWAALAVAAVTRLASAEKVDCEPARCAAQAAIAEHCPACAEAGNHGAYVSCVAHVVRDLASKGTIPINCKGKVTRCAAKSICGKPGFVTCHIPTSECIIPTGALSGTCENDPTVVCLDDFGCGTTCKIKSTSDRCVERGGAVGTESSCCANCVQG